MRLTIVNARRVRFKLEGVSRRARYTRPGLQRVYELILSIERAVFSSQGRRGGGSWRPLKPETLRRKFAQGYSPEILVASTKLMDSLTQQRDPNQIFKVFGDELVFGSKLPYAAVHQKGHGHVPARPYLRFTKRDTLRMREELRNHLMEPWRGRRVV